jgi:hypothetical protein|tara:strand:- start:77 stop:283 length:207 start_codon:yes stop_codon:yes gene_type:complete
MFWVEATSRGLEPWTARVSSKDNLADGPSRFRESGALSIVKELQLQWVAAKFPEVKLIELLFAMGSTR